MGRKRSEFNLNRSQFVPENAVDPEIKYERTGGCFVTTKKAVAFLIIAIVALAAVGTLLYFYGMNFNKKEDDHSTDIEKLLNDSINNINEQLRLPSYITPIHYRLRIHPHLEENGLENFTFTGQVTILIQSRKKTKTILLHGENLDILPDDIKISTSRSSSLQSMSQIKLENKPNSTDLKPTTFNSLSPIVNSTESPKANNSTINNTKVLAVPTLSPYLTTTKSTTLNLNSTTPKSNTTNSLNLTNFVNNNSQDPNNIILNTQTNSKTFFNITTNATITATTTRHPTSMSPTISTATTHLPYNTDQVTELVIKSYKKDVKNSLHIINLLSSIKPNINYTIDIKFSGKIENNLIGLYKTSYSTSEGNKNWLLTTHFQPIFARRVFPCFDEPSFKSLFKISIARSENMTALSNMPLKDSDPISDQPGWFWDNFESTLPMPTYLLAFTVLNFKKPIEISSNAGPTLKIWVPEEKSSQAEFARMITPKIFSYLEKYFGVKYPLPKIDLVAIPELPQKATDNWGIILFRYSSLLLDNVSDDWKIKNNIFKTIVRKLTTQWLGNLVTMNWWSEMWLVDGFSTFMEDLVEGAIEPNLENLDSFSLRIEQTILDIDKLKSVRSLHSEVKDLAQIQHIYDDVAINKGSCLIRMLNYTLTEDLFKNGVQNYLKKWSFQCANKDNFWESFTQVSENKNVLPKNLTVKTIMDSWITQEGYPVVTVERNYDNGSAVIKQSRFMHNSSSENKWYIPLTYTSKNDNGSVTTIWSLKETSMSVANLTTSKIDWILFNVDQAGFYRINYDKQNWKLLQEQLKNDHEDIPPSNRGQLLNDAFEMAFAGLLDYEVPFELAQYLQLKERNFIPWSSVYSSLRSLEAIVGSTRHYGLFQKYVVNLIKKVYDELGTIEKPEESQNTKLLRIFIINAACDFNYEPCLVWAKTQYNNWMVSDVPDKTNFKIPFRFRETVQCTAIKIGGQKEWEFLWNRTLYSLISATDLRIAYASLGCTRELWLINRYLEHSLNGDIALQNVPEVWKSISHPIGLIGGFKFLRSNWNRMYSTYSHVNSIMTTIFEEFLSKLSTTVDLEDLTSFYRNHKENLHPVSTLMLNVVDRIKWRVDWTKVHLEKVAILLNSN